MKFLFGSFFIFVFMRCIKADCANPKVDTVNVKTVLWRASDSYRVCWSKAEELLLYTRRVAQDLLPKKIPKDLSQTIHYLEIIWEAIQKFSPKISSSKEILRPAVADVLGGYLQSIALPMVNEGYYAGDVDYSVVKAFYDLYHRVKAFLDTDGRGWHKPCDMKEIPTRVSSFDYHLIPEESDRYACDELHIPQVSCEATTVCEKLKAIADPGTNVLPTKIALPFLDDEAEPTSVVIPFRDQYLFSLTSPASAHVLARYYNLAMRCIGKSDKDTLLAFNHAFYNWIVTYVAPHLHTPTHCHVETEWYPGFGSVMRILETMHQHGLTPGESRGRDYGIMSNSAIHKHGSGAGYHGFGKAITDIATGEGSGKFSVDGTLTYIKSVPYVGEMIDYDPILTLLGLIILLLILLCCIRNCCCADGNKRTGATGVCYTDKRPILTLYYKCLQTLGLRKNPAEGNTTSGYSEKDRPPADYPSRPSAIYNSERVMNTSMLDDTTTDTSSPETYEKLASRKRKPRRKERALSRRNEKSCFSRR